MKLSILQFKLLVILSVQFWIMNVVINGHYYYNVEPITESCIQLKSYVELPKYCQEEIDGFSNYHYVSLYMLSSSMFTWAIPILIWGKIEKIKNSKNTLEPYLASAIQIKESVSQ